MNKYVQFRNSNIHYRDIGTGIPLVLVHGFGEDNEVWNYQVEALRHRVRIILPDLPGSGASDILQDENGGKPGIETYAECLRVIVEQEKLDRFALIGHSMGGYACLAYAQNWSASLAGLGLFHSTALPDSAEKIATRRKGIEFMRTHGASEFLRQAIPNLFSDEFKRDNPEQVSKLIERSANFSVRTLVQYYEAMIVRPDRRGLLPLLEIPILFIIGEKDKTLNLQDSLSQSYLPSISCVHILPNAAHMGMWESIDKSNNAIMNFLDQLKVL